MSVIFPPAQEGKENVASVDTLQHSSRQLVIVQRGRFATFDRLARTFADDPHVLVIWDRRTHDRRTTVATVLIDCRRADRRRSTFRWSTDGYVSIAG